MAKPKRTIAGIAEALSRPEPPQGREGKPGDPQIAAVYQCLAMHSSLSSNDCIVDLGAGEGLLATVIEDVWIGKSPPKYVAVDLAVPLSALSLPLSVHNNSEKVVFDDFLDHRVTELAADIKLVVIRNVFHELDILTTARVITNLNNALAPLTQIYIQDLAILPNPERGNAGWDSTCFRDFLADVGMNPTLPELTSHSGIKWFFTTLQTVASELDEATVAAACAAQRRKQKQRIRHDLRTLNQDYDHHETTAEIIYLSLQLAAIDLQLGGYEASLDHHDVAPEIVQIADVEVPLRPSSEAGAPLVTVVPSNSVGLVATIRNKEDLDIARLIQRSKGLVWFAGYSQKLTFRLPENRSAVTDAGKRGVDQRFLVLDPNSDYAAIRAEHPVYSECDDLSRDIVGTIRGYIDMLSEPGMAGNRENIQLRVTDSPPPCSFFIVDDLCFVSLYSRRLTGTSGPCLVFARQCDGEVGYYELLREEFRESFDRATPVVLGFES